MTKIHLSVKTGDFFWRNVNREAYPISLAMGLTIQIQTEALIAMFPCPILLQ